MFGRRKDAHVVIPAQPASKLPETSLAGELSSDHAVSTKDIDQFQRYPFAGRIAETIKTRTNEECIVFGLYGAWGEGKTSIINFIQTELAKDEHMIILTFNPWRYSGEDDLLKQFFYKIAGTLKKELKTNGEKAAKFIGKYARFLDFDIPFVGNVKEKVEGIGELLGETDVEELKKRLGNIIKENGKKLVIFIDDIDRLEKTEIHAIFRLVKLTADFPNVIYILAFDDKMVASAIGERFGSGDDEAGRQFLEKIIQVPLRIPEANGEALEDFCLDKIKAAISSSNLQLTETQSQRLANLLPVTLLPSINTPRLAVRYANGLNFALPLLKKEVDIVDLILLEGIKILYPQYYAAITDNVDLFIGGTPNPSLYAINEHKTVEYERLLQGLGERLSRSQRKGIEILLADLFPRAKKLYERDTQTPPEITGLKRAHDPRYFSRYFSYTVRIGDLLDEAFENYIAQLKLYTNDNAIEGIRYFIEQSSSRQLIAKLRRHLDEIPTDQLLRLAEILTAHSSLFPTSGIEEFMNGETDPEVQLSIFLADVLRKTSPDTLREKLEQKLIKQAETLSFSISLMGQILNIRDKVYGTYEDHEKTLVFLIARRAIEGANNMPIWEMYKKESGFIIELWSRANILDS
jgi:hypothetical protein